MKGDCQPEFLFAEMSQRIDVLLIISICQNERIAQSPL
jgi:hypothetical protein